VDGLRRFKEPATVPDSVPILDDELEGVGRISTNSASAVDGVENPLLLEFLEIVEF